MKLNVNILIVDDEEIMRALFTDILQDEGHKVVSFPNGKEAEGGLRGEFFDIAFIDVHMPVMDGIKTLHLVRELSPKTAIVMMDSMPGYVLEEAKKQGAITCIYKPFNIKEVRSIVSKIVKNGGADG